MGATAADGARVDVRLLGGVDVLVEGRLAALGGAKPRAVLAFLAIQPGRVVSADRIVDGVWGERAPTSVRSSLQVHVSSVRKALASLGAPEVIETRQGGYVFAVEPDAVDLHRFTEQTAVARTAFQAGDLRLAESHGRRAIQMWRGAPFAGLGDVPFVVGRVSTLEDDYVSLIELLADVEISLGRAADVVGELEQLVASHPYRESAWARLALALYRSGRQVDALERMRAVRTLLAEELGLDPSPDLAALEVAILNHDPALLGARLATDGIAPAATDSRLPMLRALVGRDELVAQVSAELRDGPTGACVTLVGPGGVGKTALAVFCAARFAGEVGMARFVDLAEIDADAAVLPAVAMALGMRVDDPSDLESGLVQALAHVDAPLLVFDNCEHVLNGALAAIGTLTARCPGLRVMATTREALGLAGERQVRCAPLSVAAGAELFVRQARAADRDYVVSPDEAAAIERLVTRLDGLPLAIELFAARVASLSAADMVSQLDDAALMRAAWRNSPTSRHRTLADAITWSYDLLDPAERRALRRMAVLSGRADLACLAAVCEAGVGSVEILVQRSLVVAERTATGMRYRLLETVRAFATELLGAEPGDTAATEQRLYEHTVAWATSLRERLESADPAPAFADLEANAANVRSAYLIATRASDPAAPARLLAALGVWAPTVLTSLPELTTWVHDAYARLPAGDPLRGNLGLVLSRRRAIGAVDERRLVDEALAIAQARGDAELEAAARVGLAQTALVDVHTAGVLAEQAIISAERAGAPIGVGAGLLYGGIALVRARQPAAASALLDRHTLTGTARFGIFEPQVLWVRGRIAFASGDLDTAQRWFEASGAAAQRAGTEFGLTFAWYGLAEVARLRGDLAAAFSLYSRSLAVVTLTEPNEASTDRMMVVWTACLLGELGVAEHETAILRRDAESQRRITADADETVDACAVVAEGALALARGARSLAAEKFVRAIQVWASMDVWDLVADLLDRMPETLGAPDDGAAFAVAAAELRVGQITCADAARLVSAR